MPQDNAVTVTYFSDILCIWAYITQARISEVDRHFGDSVRVDYRFCSVFGNTEDKIGRGWADRGGYEGFNRHLQEVAAQFSHIDVHPDIWLTTRPPSSDSVHIFIKAVQGLEPLGRLEGGDEEGRVSADIIWRLRAAFFRDCRNISSRAVQCEIAEEAGIPRAAIEAEIDSGAAFAGLAADYRSREDLRIEGSPTFVLNQGRQRLYGNIGYHVIEANIRELLRTPAAGEMSWC